MKNSSSLFNFVFLFIFCAFISCSKDDDIVEPDRAGPEIIVTSPTEAQFTNGFDAGTTITITGSITDPSLIDQIRIQFSTSTGFVFVDELIEDVNKETYEVSETVQIPDATPSGNYVINIEATDKEGNESSYSKVFAIRGS